MVKKIFQEELELSSGVFVVVHGVSQLLLTRLNDVVSKKYPDLEPIAVKTNVVPGDYTSPEQTILVETLDHAEWFKSENPGLYGSLPARFARLQKERQVQSNKRGTEIVTSLFGVAVTVDNEKTKANGVLTPEEDWICGLDEYIKNTIQDYIGYFAIRTQVEFQMVSATISKLSGTIEIEEVEKITELFRNQMAE